MGGGSADFLAGLRTKVPNPISSKKIALLGSAYSGSALRYGCFAGIVFLYLTDWRVIMDRVPFYRGKFHEKTYAY